MAGSLTPVIVGARGKREIVVRGVLVGIAVVLVGAPGAGASRSSASALRVTATRESSFCQKAKAIYGKGMNLLTLPPATIKADDAVFKADQPGALASAPRAIKSDLKEVFAFDNGLFTDLSKVGWSVAKLPRSVLQSLAVSGPKLKPASDKVIGYLDSNCGLKLPKP
jgi:hypothetical protein